MRVIFKIGFLILLISLFSCDEIYYVNCDDCYVDEPVNCNVTIHFQESYETQLLYDVKIFLGRVEDGVVIDSFQILPSTGDAYFTAIINNEYTIVATTTYGDKSYRIVNSISPYTRLVEGLCTDNCYIIKNDYVNMKLKYF